MSGIDQKQSELAFHDVVDGFPVNPCGFHRYMSDLFLAQPLGKFHNVPCHSPERTNFLVNPASVIKTTNAGLNAPFMHIKAATTGIDRLHVFLPSVWLNAGGHRKIKTFYYACSAREGEGNSLGFMAMSGPDCGTSSKHHRDSAFLPSFSYVKLTWIDSLFIVSGVPPVHEGLR